MPSSGRVAYCNRLTYPYPPVLSFEHEKETKAAAKYAKKTTSLFWATVDTWHRNMLIRKKQNHNYYNF